MESLGRCNKRKYRDYDDKAGRKLDDDIHFE